MDTNTLNSIAGGDLSSISVAALFAGLLWGALSGGFLIYGWKQKAAIPLVVGVVLTAITIFLWNSALYMSLASIAVLGAFWWLKKQGY